MNQLNFEEQINELRRPCIREHFKDKNILNFLKTYINIDMLLNKYRETATNDNTSILKSLQDINDSTENVLIKELVCSIKKLYEHDTSETMVRTRAPDQTLLQKLVESFPTADIYNVDHVSKCQNVIQLKQDSKPFVMVYSEYDSTANISKKDVELFYNDIKENNACGILCNSKGGISNRESFEIDICDSNVYIFISNHQYNVATFQLAVKIIYNIYDIIKDTNGAIEIDKELLQRLKLEYNYYIMSHEKYIQLMRANLTSLENLSLQSIGHFFKRTHINSNDKPYSCQMCGTQFKTDKSLKSHLKIQHQIHLGKKRNRNEPEMPATVENEIENEIGLVSFN